MIPRTCSAWQSPAWQTELADAVRDPLELLRLLDLPREMPAGMHGAHAQFPLRVPRAYIARMRKGDPNDPLLRQVLPLGTELDAMPGFSDDPVGDLAATAAPGLLHKYHGRALLVTTGACAVHCRYCFRRHYPYSDGAATAGRLDTALAHLTHDTGISEVILSGGDPLALSDQRLAPLARQLDAIAHLKRLRIHTRLPIVLPARVDDALLEWLSHTRLRPVVVVHVNHPNEIDAAVEHALKRLAEAGAVLLNQAVLLRDVNDDADTLVKLSETLFDAGVMPYYVHLLDRVKGAAHFEVDEQTAHELHAALWRRLPGYLVPRLVREEPGAPGKMPLSSSPSLLDPCIEAGAASPHCTDAHK